MEQKKLRRSNNRMLAGVVAGLAEYFDVDITMLRVAYTVLTILSAAFPGVLIYLLLMCIMPNQEIN